MPEKQATVMWSGDLRSGQGQVATPDSVLDHVPLTFPQRFENVPGASPEELIAAAHAACFSMALASGLSKLGHPPGQLMTRATIAIESREGSWVITRSHLAVQGQVSGIDDRTFQEAASQAEEACPVSKALHGNVQISLDAVLLPAPEPI